MQVFASRISLILVAFVLFVSSPVGIAQSLRPDRRSPSVLQTPGFGVSSSSIATVPALSFQLVVGSQEGIGLDGSKTCETGGCGWLAPLALPTGARITALELEACDSDASLDTTFLLRAQPSPMQTPVVISPIGSTTGSTGCGLFSVSLDHTVDNLANSYVIEISEFAGQSLRFGAARVSYMLQVSPAPPAATFNDVPTDHPRFQFIEALSAAGLTAGCGGGNYCPDSPLTRGQLAVFLARALGLYFPN